MVNHKKIYCNYFGYDVGDIIVCEVCKDECSRPFHIGLPPILREAVDIHHISPRGMGGSKLKDYPENLIALCREHHIEVEQSKEANKRCYVIHLKNIIKKIEEDDLNNINW